MKIYLFPVVIAGFILTFIMQAFSYSTIGLQTQMLQKQLTEINQKLDKIQIQTQNQTAADPTAGKLKAITAKDSSFDSSDLLSPENLSKTLGATTDGTKVSLKPSWTAVDVYETTKASSKIVGKIDTGKTYPITQRSQDWYQIKLDNGVSAWVQAQFVYETL